MQTRGVFFKPGFTGLAAFKPGYPGTRVCFDVGLRYRFDNNKGLSLLSVRQAIVTCQWRLSLAVVN